MKTATKWIALSAAAALAVGIGTYAVTASSQEAGHPFGPMSMGNMGTGMMGAMMGGAQGNNGFAGMGHDSATMAQLGDIHDLFANNEKIKRTVTNLPDGIRTVTESDDPGIAKLIKDHVADMGKRVAAADDPGLPIESPALHAIFKNYDKIVTKTETTEKGVVVIQTSADAPTVAALQQHATEVSDFVKEGMPAMQNAMMKNMPAMMANMMAGMQGGMADHMHGQGVQ